MVSLVSDKSVSTVHSPLCVITGLTSPAQCFQFPDTSRSCVVETQVAGVAEGIVRKKPPPGAANNPAAAATAVAAAEAAVAARSRADMTRAATARVEQKRLAPAGKSTRQEDLPIYVSPSALRTTTETLDRAVATPVCCATAVVASPAATEAVAALATGNEYEAAGQSPLPQRSITKASPMKMTRAERREADLLLKMQLLQQRQEIVQARAQLTREQDAHASRVARVDSRETVVHQLKSELEKKESELKEWSDKLQAYEAEQEWEHWRKDSMRKVSSEIERKVPPDEWKQRMQRVLTSLDLYKRENIRLKASVSTGASGTEHEDFVIEDLQRKQEALVAQAIEAGDKLRAVRKTELAREAYLLRVQEDSAEASARNAAQQQRLEALTSENSKLKKENTKLKADVTGARMAAFQNDLLENELRSAKEAVESMEQQIARLQHENSALRAGGGLDQEVMQLQRELANVQDSTREAQHAITAGLRRAQAEVTTLQAGLADAETTARARELSLLTDGELSRLRAKRTNDAQMLAAAVDRMSKVEVSCTLAWALSSWHATTCFGEMGDIFCKLRDSVDSLVTHTGEHLLLAWAWVLAHTNGMHKCRPLLLTGK